MAKIGECCKKIDHENKKMVWQIKEAAMNNNNVKLNIPQQESVDEEMLPEEENWEDPEMEDFVDGAFLTVPFFSPLV